MHYITKEEVWKSVSGYEGMYEVSNFGSVRSVDRKVKSNNGLYKNIKGKTMAQATKTEGYKVVSLWKNNKGKTHYVHRLVISSFSSDFPNETVNHKDGDKSNNHIDNLEWMSYAENNLHAYKNGLNDHNHRRNCKGSFKVEQRDLQGNLIKTYPSYRQAERETGIDSAAISLGVIKGWKYGGFIWARVE